MRLPAAIALALCLALPALVEGATTSVQLGPVADAFTSAANPDSNYGGAGALVVSAPGLPNGAFYTAMQFDFSTAKTAFDTAYGTGGWMVTGVVLTGNLSTGPNPLFNPTVTAGKVTATWFNGAWTEGVGNPNAPGTSGITHNSLVTLLAGTTEVVGTYVYDGSPSGTLTFPLVLNPHLLGSVTGGSMASLALTPADSAVNLFFNSRSFKTTTAQPYITVTAGAARVITTSAAPAAGGSVSGGGTFLDGSSVTLSATPANNYVFVSWTEGGRVVSSTADYTFIAGASRTLMANFALNIPEVITTSAAPAAGGTTSGDGTYAPGGSVLLTATPAAGYAFVNWTEGGTVASTSASYSFIAGSNRALVAHFSLIIPVLSIVATAPGSYTLSWPGALPGWALQENGGLGANLWAGSTRGVSIVGGQNQVTVTGVGNRRFFRLVHTP